jgi:Domain of unknown function (DUF1902)
MHAHRTCAGEAASGLGARQGPPHRVGFQPLGGGALLAWGYGLGGRWSSLQATEFAPEPKTGYLRAMSTFKVEAHWDPEAGVFFSQSDIPGLVIESATFEEFVALVEVLAPQMLEANLPAAKRPFQFNIESHRSLAVA